MNYVVESYENYNEENRLTTNNARKVEFITTVRAFGEIFPPKAKILDCAAGTGAYAFYLADNGYDVTATDITPRHIKFIDEQQKSKNYTMKTAVLDATDLSIFEDESFDIVLNMGPFYHLVDIKMREKCLTESLRVLKKSGLLLTAYISKFFIFPYVSINDTTLLKTELANTLIDIGALLHDDENCFWTDSYYASVTEMESLYESQNLKIVDHFAQDGISTLLKNNIDQYDDEQFKIWCDYHYKTCREKSILGSSNHIVIVGEKTI